jgi:mRNA-degrading endonuclease RelE of RelBE toxin-antitoxin system
MVLDRVEKQLAYEPSAETRNRKPMRPNPLAPWELRIGTLRVYYDVVEDPEAVVLVRAVGVKDRNAVRIGRKEILL